MFFKSLVLSFCLILSNSAFANSMFNVDTLQPETMEDVVDQVVPGSIVILGESHAVNGGTIIDQQNQVEFIKALTDRYENVHVGMEFINYTVQDALDDYLRGDISEEDFKTAVGWGGNPFDHYKQQILLPLEVMGWSHALNAPRELTRAIAREGLENLTPELKALMPPNFELGSDIYEKRFYEIMGVVHDDAAPDFVVNMFAAQCTWDDTMAWKAIEKFNTNPQQIMVIIVGNFHARYGGGLADRLQARGFDQIMTIVQVKNEGLTDQEIEDLALPHPDYGVIADYLW